jgi:hypothetical protein
VLSTRLSTFRRSITRHRHSSIQNRSERRRTNVSYPSPSLTKPTYRIWWKKYLAFICPCFIKDLFKKKTLPEQQQHELVEQNNLNETLPAIVPQLIIDDDLGGVSSPFFVNIRSPKGGIDNDDVTCDTVLIKNENEDQELLTDENDVTIELSSFCAEPTLNNIPIEIDFHKLQRNRSNSEGYILKSSVLNRCADNQSLK